MHIVANHVDMIGATCVQGFALYFALHLGFNIQLCYVHLSETWMAILLMKNHQILRINLIPAICNRSNSSINLHYLSVLHGQPEFFLITNSLQ